MALFSLFLAGLLGSPHCAGMCGGFVALYSSNAKTSMIPHVLYNAGRLISYTILGAIAALLAQKVDSLSNHLAGIQQVSLWLVALFLLAYGISLLFPNLYPASKEPISEPKSGLFRSSISKLFQRVFRSKLSANYKASFIGLLSSQYPKMGEVSICDKLYA